jgi:zinc and cadmium transporter
VIIASAYLVGFSTGMVATVAVLAHEVPKEVGDFGVFVEGGHVSPRRRAGKRRGGPAGLSRAGLTLGVGLHFDNFGPWMLPITAGVFCYIAASSLIPQMNAGGRLGRGSVQFGGVLRRRGHAGRGGCTGG